MRVFSKARRDFIESMILEHLGRDGRVHPEWRPLRGDDGGTGGGRYACTDPNLQQVPARDPIVGPMVRSCFLPEEGECWGVFDVQQQEPRFTVHYAARANMPGAQEAVRRINENPRVDYHQMVADMTGIGRKQAKTINLGRAYGMGGAKLCDQLGLPTEIWERRNQDGSVTPIRVAGALGKAIIKQYDTRFPFIGPLAQSCSNAAEKRGWIRTYVGRLCRFPEWESSEWGTGMKERFATREEAVERLGSENVRRAWTHKALNRLIQGSSGDMIKLAMLKVWKETGRVPLLTIHDELDISCEADHDIIEISRCIRESVELLVPLSLDVELGSNWGELKPWKETT
jgi:DNA polymerase I-like protein with 3'-5' exonuclease and polymerase domains